jgi:hypothetical protein
MPTTTAHSYLNVPLPTGVAAVDHWRPNDPLPYRVVLGAGRAVTDHDVVLHDSIHPSSSWAASSSRAQQILD